MFGGVEGGAVGVCAFDGEARSRAAAASPAAAHNGWFMASASTQGALLELSKALARVPLRKGLSRPDGIANLAGETAPTVYTRGIVWKLSRWVPAEIAPTA